MWSFYTFHCTDNFDIINNWCAVVSVIPFLSFVLFHSFTPAKNEEINITIVAYVCMLHISSWTSGLTLMKLCINIALGYFDYQNLYGVYKYSIQTPQSHILVTLPEFIHFLSTQHPFFNLDLCIMFPWIASWSTICICSTTA